MKRLHILLGCLILIQSLNAVGISGVVIDEQSKEPLPGVKVSLIDSLSKVVMQTSTNGNGWFSLNDVKKTETFVGLSYMG